MVIPRMDIQSLITKQELKMAWLFFFLKLFLWGFWRCPIGLPCFTRKTQPFMNVDN